MSSVLLSDLSVGDQASFDRALAASSVPARPKLVYHPVAGTVYEGPLVDRAAEEWCNSLTHGIGAVLSVAGAFVLMGKLGTHDWSIVAASAVYLATLVGVYVCSTLSHYIEHPEWKHTFRVFDQAFIYLLIVGTYTPVAAMYLYGGGLSILFWAMWGVAIAGFLSKTLFQQGIDSIATGVYVALAFMPMVAAYTALSVLPQSAILLIILGGISYLLGLVFFTRDHRVPYAHAAWHVLVMGGSACHFYAICDCLSAIATTA